MTPIKNIRKKNKITVRKLAEILNMNFGYLSQVENGLANISPQTLERIATEFNEPLDPLLVAYGYLPEYTREARQKDPEQMEKGIKRVTKKIMREE